MENEGLIKEKQELTPVVQKLDAKTVEKVLIGGDLSALNVDERMNYYNKLCVDLGLNPLTKPFDYLNLNGKVILYALKSCTEQLRQIHNVSINIKARDTVNKCYVVTVQATLPSGRTDESIGAVSIDNLYGDKLCNNLMKAETKAKRRVTLSICGLSMLDETEIETVPAAVKHVFKPATEAIVNNNVVETKEIVIQQEAEKIDGKPKGDAQKALKLIPLCDSIEVLDNWENSLGERLWDEGFESMIKDCIVRRKQELTEKKFGRTFA